MEGDSFIPPSRLNSDEIYTAAQKGKDALIAAIATHVAPQDKLDDPFAVPDLSNRVDIDTIRGTSGLTALHLAILDKNQTAVSALLAARARPDIPAGPYKRTALHVAAETRAPAALASELLKARASVNAADAHGVRPLLLTFPRRAGAPLGELSPKGVADSASPPPAAAPATRHSDAGSAELAQLLLLAGARASPHRAGADGAEGQGPVPEYRSALHLAVRAGAADFTALITALVRAGADPDAPAVAGCPFPEAEAEAEHHALSAAAGVTPAVIAAKDGNLKAYALLLSAGASAPAPQGVTIAVRTKNNDYGGGTTLSVGPGSGKDAENEELKGWVLAQGDKLAIEVQLAEKTRLAEAARRVNRM